jgi:hypothetical protein
MVKVSNLLVVPIQDTAMIKTCFFLHRQIPMFLFQSRSNQKIWNCHNKLFPLRSVSVQSIKSKLETQFYGYSRGRITALCYKIQYLDSNKVWAQTLSIVCIAHSDLHDAYSPDSEAIWHLERLSRQISIENIYDEYITIFLSHNKLDRR